MISRDDQPKLSAIVIAQGSSDDTLRALIRAWSYQTACGKVEIVFVCPSREQLRLETLDLDYFASWQVVEIEKFTSTAAARTAGIHAARAPVIALTEDHCFPSRQWAQVMIERHYEEWTGVGPVFFNANPGSVTSWANLLAEYGHWIDLNSCGEVDHMPGHNSTYKRCALMHYGERLPEVLEAESAMQWDMKTRGHRFYLEPKAHSHHFNFSRLPPSIVLRFHGGRLFAANRARQWGVPRRLFYTLASPLIPVVRFFRCAKAASNVNLSWRRLTIFPVMALLLGVDALGEMFGYATGSGNAMQWISGPGEFQRPRFLRKRDQQLFRDWLETG